MIASRDVFSVCATFLFLTSSVVDRNADADRFPNADLPAEGKKAKTLLADNAAMSTAAPNRAIIPIVRGSSLQRTAEDDRRVAYLVVVNVHQRHGPWAVKPW